MSIRPFSFGVSFLIVAMTSLLDIASPQGVVNRTQVDLIARCVGLFGKPQTWINTNSRGPKSLMSTR
jgi:hypothetical protein